jgi:hypothetical protein
VGDEDDRDALGGQRPEHLEQVRDLLRGEDGCRLVEDEHLGAAMQHAQDLHALLLADPDVLHVGARVDAEPEALRELADPLLGGVAVQHRPLRRLGREDDVLRDRHDRDEHEVLVHHADLQPDRLARRADVHRLAAEEHLALVGLVQPVEDVHERGLPRTVLPEEGVHLTATDIEVDAVVRGECAEALGDALQLEGERGALLGQGCDPT